MMIIRAAEIISWLVAPPANTVNVRSNDIADLFLAAASSVPANRIYRLAILAPRPGAPRQEFY